MLNRIVLVCVLAAMTALIIYGLRVESGPRPTDVLLPQAGTTDRLPRAVRLGAPDA